MPAEPEFVRRRPRRRSLSPWLLLVPVALAGLVAAAGVGYLAFRPGTDTPVPGRGDVRDDWTHKEFADHLRGHGLPVITEAADPAETIKYPGAVVAFMATEQAVREEQGGPLYPSRHPGVITVLLYATEQAARESAGRHGERAFSAGRFAVLHRGGPFAESVKAAVGGR